MPISKAHLMTAAVALAAFATVAFVQRKFIAVPVVGDYLPK
ncbi:hypothetical protein [Roseateles violae]|uniref:Uncharacterized protein n=1 Tax=Roseateles violae TaxID=3058042 RepID=A0ABT8DU36_9BURK|nr:hypothetical protein [Pelomonas sp. PFR6]MDN3921513.1 hypothetical protein [Pelomonas sp. PFR6]